MLLPPGFPIQKSPGQRILGSSPGLIAAGHVFHRLPTPRHPPSALSFLALYQDPSLYHYSKVPSQHSSIVKVQSGRPDAGLRLMMPANIFAVTVWSKHAKQTIATLGLKALILQLFWWRWRESNPRHPACKAGALPIELHPHFLLALFDFRCVRLVFYSGHGQKSPLPP